MRKKAKEKWKYTSHYERKGGGEVVLYSPAMVVLKLKFNKFTNGDNSHCPLTCFTDPRFLTILSKRGWFNTIYPVCVKYLRDELYLHNYIL